MPDDQTALPPIIARQRSLAIKGLSGRLPERGRIKIGMKGAVKKSQGGKEFQQPVKLDHFLITTLERGADNNFIQDAAIHEMLGADPTEIPVRLLYDDVALNFPTRYAAYDGRTQWCSGDGETATRLDGKAGAPRQVQCTCPLQEPTYTGAKKCKMNGALSVLIEGAGGVGGVWTFRTTSYNSVVGLLSSMAFIKSVTGGVLANIPLTLAVRPKQATDPQGKAQTIYVVGLEFRGNIAELQQLGHKIALDRATTHLSIEHIQDEARRVLMLAPPANAVLPGDDPDDVVEEFYPEEAANAPARPSRADFTPTPEAPAADQAEEDPAEPFDAIAFEVGFLSMLDKASTAHDCQILLDQSADEFPHLDQDTREKLIRKANAKAGDLEKAPKTTGKYMTVDADGIVLVEHARPRSWCDEIAAVLAQMPAGERLRCWQANEPVFRRIKSESDAMTGKHAVTVQQFVADFQREVMELLPASGASDPFALGNPEPGNS